MCILPTILENEMNEVIIRPDSKGRLNLGEIVKGVSSFRATIDKNGKVTLEPYAEIPFEDKWIFDNKDLLEKIKQQHAKENDV